MLRVSISKTAVFLVVLKIVERDITFPKIRSAVWPGGGKQQISPRSGFFCPGFSGLTRSRPGLGVRASRRPAASQQVSLVQVRTLKGRFPLPRVSASKQPPRSTAAKVPEQGLQSPPGWTVPRASPPGEQAPRGRGLGRGRSPRRRRPRPQRDSSRRRQGWRSWRRRPQIRWPSAR